MFGRVADEAVRRFHECLLGVYAIAAGTFVRNGRHRPRLSEPRSGETELQLLHSPAVCQGKILIFENDYFRTFAAICSSNAIILFVLRM
jgi:hypothetical protein